MEKHCKIVKEEYMNCLKKYNLGFDPELLKFRANKMFTEINPVSQSVSQWLWIPYTEFT